MRKSLTPSPVGSARRESSVQELEREAQASAAFGHQMRGLREDLGYTQAQVSQASGVDRAFLSDIERGRKSPTLRTLRALARAYGMRVAEIMEMCGA